MPSEITERPLDDPALLADDADQTPETAEGEDPLKDQPELQQAVKKLAVFFMAQELSANRIETIETRRQRFYWANEQYVYFPFGGTGFATMAAGMTIRLNDGSSVDTPRYTNVYNIFTPYGESIISVLAQNPPGIDFQPENPMKPEDCLSAELAEKFRHKIARDNDQKNLQAEVARLMWTDTRVVLKQEYVVDGDGEDAEGTQRITLHGTLESKVPITRALVCDWPYAFISDEIDIVTAKADDPDVKDSIKPGASSLGETAYRRIARLGVLQGGRQQMQVGDAYAHLVTRHHVYLRPETIEQVPDEFKEKLKELFPEGIHAKFVGDAYCWSKNESMDECLAVGYPTPGDGASRASLGKRIVPLQDDFNDGMNLMHEAHDHCIPTTYFDQDVLDPDALRSQLSEPGNHVPCESPANGKSISESFFIGDASGVPTTLPATLDMISNSLAQFLSGALPALVGQGEANNKTKGGIELLRDSALGRVGLPWASLQQLFATAYEQAIKCAAKHQPDGAEVEVMVPGKRGAVSKQSIPIDGLKRGNFRCFPDADSSFPETTAAKRQVYWNLMTAAEANPILAETMVEPDNQEEGFRLIGLEELVVPGKLARDKQLLEIEQLLAEVPIPPTPEEVAAAMQAEQAKQQMAQVAGSMGLPVPPQTPPTPQEIEQQLFKPSVPIDKDFDLHKYEFMECQRWLNSEERREEERKNGSGGIENVRLHGLAHKAAMAAEAPMMPPMPPPKGTKGGAPPPPPTNGLGSAPPPL